MQKQLLTMAALALVLQGCFKEPPQNNPDPQDLNSGGGGFAQEDLSNFTPSESNKAALDPAPQTSVQLSGIVAGFAGGAQKPGARGLGSLSNIAGAQVDLIKRFANNTTQTVATTTSDAQGNYSFSGVDAAVTGEGETQDFYYEVVATSGDVTLSAPVAPTSDDAAADVTPDSDLASRIVKNVVKVPGASNRPVPSGRSMLNLRQSVKQNVEKLKNSISLADSTAVNNDKVNAAANGIASTGGNAEIMYKSYQFNSEWVRLNKVTASTEAEFSHYLKRVAREQCGQQSGQDPLPQLVSDAMATAAKAGTTYTPTQIVTALNNANPNGSLDIDYAVKRYAFVLDQIENNMVVPSTEANTFEAKHVAALLTMRQLRSWNISATSALDVDQAAAFLLYVGESGATTNDQPAPPPPAKLSQRNNPPSNLCQVEPKVLINAVAELTGNSALTQPAIADAQLFHDSGFGCDAGAGKGHFRAEINVFAGNTSVTGITVTSSDTTALGGDGTINVTEEFGGKYRSSENGQCVTMGQDVTYTVTASFADGSTATETYSRSHPSVPESQARYNGVDMSRDHVSPTKVTEYRPTISWDSPATVLSSITNAPTGAAVKYTYEFSYVDTSQQQMGPLGQCDSIAAGGKLYDVDSFMPTVDCNPAACATASGVAQANLQCRIAIQTYVVDEADRLLGQAAGNFTYYCVDADANGQCDG